jgi:hypothetical protein
MKTSEKVNILIEQNKILQEQIQAQNEQMQAQNEQMQAQNALMRAQQQQIDELVILNREILVNTDKMGKHIDFINRSYDKITQSYFFKNLLG